MCRWVDVVWIFCDVIRVLYPSNLGKSATGLTDEIAGKEGMFGSEVGIGLCSCKKSLMLSGYNWEFQRSSAESIILLDFSLSLSGRSSCMCYSFQGQGFLYLVKPI